MAVTNGLNSLSTVTSDFTHVYFKSGIAAADGDYSSPDFEFPVVEGSINYNTGEIDYSYVKLCTGAVWSSKKTKGDPDISFNIACNEKVVAQLFGSISDIETVKTPINETGSAGVKISMSSIKVAKGTVIFTDDAGHAEIITACELTAARSKDEVAYWAVKVTPTSESELIIV
ncbi:MAG: hypothetical protein MJZ32_12790 [Bacteroidaceae bacterium]|nr:hypothetical protein [Bacteroidaceae bacterium]